MFEGSLIFFYLLTNTLLNLDSDRSNWYNSSTITLQHQKINISLEFDH
jgi:hypothetical protein